MTINKKYTIYGSWRSYDNNKTEVIEKYGEAELNEVISDAITTMLITIHEQVVKTDHDDSMIDTDSIVNTLLDYIWQNDHELQEQVSQSIQDEKRQFYNSLHDRQQNNTQRG